MDNKEIKEIINDLNISIADVETLQATLKPVDKTRIDYLKRAAGQMKAARSSIILAGQEVNSGSR